MAINVKLKSSAINVRLQTTDPKTTVRSVAITPPPTSANQFNEFDLLDAFDGCTLVYDAERQKFVAKALGQITGGSF
jgi:hypothetical protein